MLMLLCAGITNGTSLAIFQFLNKLKIEKKLAVLQERIEMFLFQKLKR